MTKEQLYKLISVRTKEYQKRNQKKLLSLFVASTAIFFIYDFLVLNNGSIIDSLIRGLCFSLLFVFIGFIVWLPFFNSIKNEEKDLEQLKKRYLQEFQETWYE